MWTLSIHKYFSGLNMETGQAKLTITLLHLRTEVVGETEGVRLKRVLAVATKRQKYFLPKSSVIILSTSDLFSYWMENQRGLSWLHIHFWQLIKFHEGYGGIVLTYQIPGIHGCVILKDIKEKQTAIPAPILKLHWTVMENSS